MVISHTSLHCNLVSVQFQQYGYGILQYKLLDSTFLQMAWLIVVNL